ncbi:Signal transduction histidine kinase CheA [hydrothermal vent metagenome]|uniref:Chemotaxis protein CheA n=1 Tax=hydrothermal vent metagenome TaxID=652676 RepID=A0A3B0YSX8_9ZZZZ
MTDASFQIFADEARELLQLAEEALLNLDDLTDEEKLEEIVGDLFRTFHTIKGAAGLFGFDSIVSFTHIVENVLVRIRDGKLQVDDTIVSLFLSSRDHLEHLVDNALNQEEADQELVKVNTTLLQQLNQFLDSPEKQVEAKDQNDNIALESADSVSNGNGDNGEADNNSNEPRTDGVENVNWHISLRFDLNVFRDGMDPASFITYLSNIGTLKEVAVVSEKIPKWGEFDPESCYLGFEIELFAPETNKLEILEVFEFVAEDCIINILPPHSKIEDYISLIEALPEKEMRIGDILVACGALTLSEKDQVLNAQDKIVDQKVGDDTSQVVPPLGEVAVQKQVVEKEVVDAALKKQGAVKKSLVNAQQTIRVNALKLEGLVNLVGELVIGSANSELNAQRVGDPELTEAMENLLRLVEEVRDTALGLRMVQIGETFNRFKRVVHEVSRDLAKEIDLVISGADTELDKTLIEKIGDPLMHLVRNAIDHGVESPQDRVAAGKSSRATVNLEAFHDSGSIVIQIRDDGRGLDKDKIFKKAVEKGFVDAEQQLKDSEIYRLIFEAGFSTAEAVSNLSGRGVGMDVVRRNIETLRGTVEIDSEFGKGTTISIRLPLTLAIIDGFQVRVGGAQYVMPLDMVDECIELTDSLRGSDADANYVNLRGDILPFVRLGDIFGESRKEGDESRDNIVVVQFAGKRAGFVVDEFLGEHQTVIKPLGKVFQNLKGISGATILGSGEVAMVLDIPEIIKRVESVSRKQSAIH